MANDYIRGALPEMYALNRNYTAYQINSITGADFSLWDEHTVKRLLVEKPDLMPHYPIMNAIDKGYNLAYCKTKITDVVTSGILQGLSIPHMADKLSSEVAGMNRASAVRAARTATTSAECAGTMDELNEAAARGIECEKEWMATLDGRTRHTHGVLDGKHVPLNKKFGNGLMYPGDPAGAPGEIYNCRCTMIPWFADVEARNAKPRETYSEWRRKKDKPDATKSLIYGHGDGRIETSEGLFRQSQNQGAFSVYPLKISKKTVRQIAKKYGVSLKGITLYVDKDEGKIGNEITGWSDYFKVGTIQIFPDAFKSEEELIKTIVHEKEHVKQFKKYGVITVLKNTERFEAEAYEAEKKFINNLRKAKKI